MTLPQLPLCIRMKLIQDRIGDPECYLPTDEDSVPKTQLGLPGPTIAQRFFSTAATPTKSVGASGMSSTFQCSPPPSSLYLQLGSAMVKTVIKPDYSSTPRLEFVCDVGGFCKANPGFVAYNDQLFLTGRSARFYGDEDKHEGGHDGELWLYHCSNLLDSDDLHWTVYSPTTGIKLSAYSPYVVQVGGKIYMFGGRNNYIPTAESHWGCLFDLNNKSWTPFDNPPREDCMTFSHFIWDEKIYVFCLGTGKSHSKLFICSCDTTTGFLSNEIDMCEMLDCSFLEPKIVVGDILIVFYLKERVIRVFDLKNKRWIDQEFGMLSFSPAPSTPDEFSMFDPYHEMFVAKSPHTPEHNELILLWQVESVKFYISRILVHVEKGLEGGTESVSVEDIQQCVEVDVDPVIFHIGHDIPGVAAWS